MPEAGIEKCPAIIGKTYEFGSGPVIEREDERRDDRIDQIDEKKEKSGADEQPGPDRRAAVEVAGCLQHVSRADGKDYLQQFVG
ncbi:hypothetical protein D3C71_2011820 [compost metagenome]